MKIHRLSFSLPVAIGILCASTAGQVTTRVSVDSTGAQANGMSIRPAISADGRFVAFSSSASNLIPGDTNLDEDVFVKDRLTGRTRRMSQSSLGDEGNDASTTPSISGNGRFVVFFSLATNLVLGDTNSLPDVFVHDRQTGLTERVNVDSAGVQANGGAFFHHSISADGRFVAFESLSDNLVPGDTNGEFDLFVRDRANGTTRRVNVDSAGVEANNTSNRACLSADGRFVLFESQATNLVAGDTNLQQDVFLHDLQTGSTVRVSLSSSGVQADGGSYAMSISQDNRWIAFQSYATNLFPGDTNQSLDAFVRDLVTGTTYEVSLDLGGVAGDGDSGIPILSADGRFVAFESFATDIVSGDTNHTLDVFVRDMLLGSTTRVSVNSAGVQGNGGSGWVGVTMSPDARFVVFESVATNLVEGDTNGTNDIFVHDRAAAGFASVCEPGANGVRSCPCANPPSGLGRGCDNSSSTGGASLSASGAAYLSMDSLALTAAGEAPTAFSVVLQGNSFLASGAIYGQGVRCAGGSLLRLYSKPAVAGGLTVPDLAAGDPTVSARSAERGDVIQPGQSRWYSVYYRDPVVLGGCPAEWTFNATQAGRVDWSL